VQGVLRFAFTTAHYYARRTKGPKSSDLLANLVSAGYLGVFFAVDKFDLNSNNRFLTYAVYWIRERIVAELDNRGLVHIPVHRLRAMRVPERKKDLNVTILDGPQSLDTLQASDDIEHQLMSNAAVDFLWNALYETDLRARDKFVLLAYFGAKRGPKTLLQIAACLGMSAERARRTKNAALERLKEHLRSLKVYEAADLVTE
jgi:RNA polymerase sigma factor (sigma-70 family)